MSTALIPSTSVTATGTSPATSAATAPAAASTATVPTDVLSQIRNAYGVRQLAQQELVTLETQRADTKRNSADQWAASVIAQGKVDPAAAETAHDNWSNKDEQIQAQEQAIVDLLQLVEARIVDFKKSNPAEVAIVLRDQIATLSQEHREQEKEEAVTEKQLKQLWIELYDVDSTARPAKPASKAAATKKK
jgi:hypothetical protein